MQVTHKFQPNLPGKHCRCGALRDGTSRRCEKCQDRASWYRHNCRRPRRQAPRPAHDKPGLADTSRSRPTAGRPGQRPAVSPPAAHEGR